MRCTGIVQALGQLHCSRNGSFEIHSNGLYHALDQRRQVVCHSEAHGHQRRQAIWGGTRPQKATQTVQPLPLNGLHCSRQWKEGLWMGRNDVRSAATGSKYAQGVSQSILGHARRDRWGPHPSPTEALPRPWLQFPTVIQVRIRLRAQDIIHS